MLECWLAERKDMFTWLLVLIFIAILGYFGLYTYNKLASASQYIRTAWDELDVLLTQRYQILGETIRKVANFTNREQALVQKLIDLRYTALLLQKKGGNRSFQENMITAEIPNICDLLKKYTELKDDKQMMNLLKELISITEHIQVAIRLYNKTAQLINSLIQTFPASLIADMWHFTSVNPIEFQDVALPNLDSSNEATSTSEEKTPKKERGKGKI